jgi:hypothetical protein
MAAIAFSRSAALSSGAALIVDFVSAATTV